MFPGTGEGGVHSRRESPELQVKESRWLHVQCGCSSTEGPDAVSAVAGLTPWSWAGQLKEEGLEAGSSLGSVVQVCERSCREDLGVAERESKVCGAVLRPAGQCALAPFAGTNTCRPSTPSSAEAGPPLHCPCPCLGAWTQHDASYISE